MIDSIYQERKQRTEMITEQLKHGEATRPSHVFKSQTSRFRQEKSAPRQQYEFQAHVGKDKTMVHEGDSLNLSKNRSQVMRNKHGCKLEKLGFNMISPRFNNTGAYPFPGPGEYHTEDIDLELDKSQMKMSKLLASSTRNKQKNKNIKIKDYLKASGKQKAQKKPHSYVGHGSLLKKTYNKLLSPRAEE